jgi:hypothetical protein
MTLTLAPLLLAAFLLAFQGVLLRVSCAVCAYDDPPPYASALWTALVASTLALLAVGAWSCTFGLFVTLVLGSAVSSVLSGLVGVTVTAEVYRRRLATTAGHALVITLVHHAMAAALSAVLWGVLGWLG